jgi:GNAT superfamily N-acetyltransferase
MVKFPKPSMDVPAQWAGDDLPAALLQLLYNPHKALLHAEFPQLLERFPGHLHIDLLLGYQRLGYGRLLMSEFLGKLRRSNVRGVHLIMAGDNIGAEAFYRKQEFDRFPLVLDGGESGEFGREGGNQNVWLVREM